MLYDNDNPIVQITGVAHMKWASGRYHISPRPFCALAFRIQGTAAITVGGTEYHVGPKEILYLPQNLAYTARYSDTEMLVVHFTTASSDHSLIFRVWFFT